ncbi:PQQ-binding-like beta-propeller repeat protein [Embleya sp. NPDC050154]|uniref:outer membrane protein assembly factor BamB family protein n=1 Tax=Embleya sp. NPDC050154 TaxID=3363988 RepID=UPI0037A238BB
MRRLSARRRSGHSGAHPTGSTAASPAIADTVVYVGASDGTVHALDAATGIKRWTYPTGSTSFPPATADGKVYLGARDGTPYALDAATDTGP